MRLLSLHTKTIEELIERYQQPLYWHIRRMVVSHEDAQDVLQNTFIQVHLHLSELRDPAQERAWIYRIATNEALLWLRNKKEFLSLEDEDAGPLLRSLATDPYVENSDRLVVLMQEAVLRLPTMQRTVFNLRYYDELPYEEIASITGSSISAAKTNYHYAKERISNYVTSKISQ